MKVVITKPENPVGRVLRQRLPDYLAWFPVWRDQRNMVKQGVNFGTVGPTGNLGITFNIFDEEGGLIIDFEGGQTVRLSDIRKALEMSLRVTWLTFSVGQEAQAAG